MCIMRYVGAGSFGRLGLGRKNASKFVAKDECGNDGEGKADIIFVLTRRRGCGDGIHCGVRNTSNSGERGNTALFSSGVVCGVRIRFVFCFCF